MAQLDEEGNPLSVREREKRRKQREREKQGNTPSPDSPEGENTPVDYSFGDPGRMGDPNYTYRPGDEFNNPGPEPPRDSPEWPKWKEHAKAWRNFIGQRQNYVDTMIGMGYEPEDLGILPQKEQGLAGWNRLHSRIGEGGGAGGWEYDWKTGKKRNVGTSDVTARDRWYAISPSEWRDYNKGGNYIDILRERQSDWIRNVAAGKSGSLQVDPTTGLYYNDTLNGTREYFDKYGAKVDNTGKRLGGAYGDNNLGRIVTSRHAAQGTGMGNAAQTAKQQAFTPLKIGDQGMRLGTPDPNWKPEGYRPEGSYQSGSNWGGWANTYGKKRTKRNSNYYYGL